MFMENNIFENENLDEDELQKKIGEREKNSEEFVMEKKAKLHKN